MQRLSSSPVINFLGAVPVKRCENPYIQWLKNMCCMRRKKE